MVFQFEHVGLDHGASKWDVHPLRLRDLKASFGRWQAGLADVGWNSLYWDNHDQPRIVSRWGDGSPLSAKTLGTLLHLHRGTPYVYQGEELGMTNYPSPAIDEFRDIESVNHYADAIARGRGPGRVLAGLRRMSRDNARIDLLGDRGEQGPFFACRPLDGPVNRQVAIELRLVRRKTGKDRPHVQACMVVDGLDRGLFADDFADQRQIGALFVHPLLAQPVDGGVFLDKGEALVGKFAERHCCWTLGIEELVEEGAGMIIVEAS